MKIILPKEVAYPSRGSEEVAYPSRGSEEVACVVFFILCSDYARMLEDQELCQELCSMMVALHSNMPMEKVIID